MADGDCLVHTIPRGLKVNIIEQLIFKHDLYDVAVPLDPRNFPIRLMRETFYDIFGNVRHNSAAAVTFAEFVKATNHTGL